MAYTGNQDSAVGGLCIGASNDGDLNLSEEYLIIVLLSLEWLVFVGFLGFLTYRIVLQNNWKKEEGQEVDDLTMLQKPPPINENLQQEDEVNEHELHDYAEDDEFEFNFNEDFYEDINFMEYLSEDDSKEEEVEFDYDDDDDDDDKDEDDDDDDDGNVDDDDDDLDYYNNDHNKDDEDDDDDSASVYSHLPVPYEPSAYETSDDAFEGIADEELWGRNRIGDFEAWPYNDWD